MRGIDELPPVVTAETLARGPGIVDLWYCPIDAVAELTDGAMSEDERERCERLRFQPDRRAYRVTRMLVRTVLSRYLPAAPADWRFAEGPRGKPYVAGPIVAPRIHFNLSHTRQLVVCAVSVNHELLGVDTEAIERQVDVAGLAREHLSAVERAALDALPAADRLAGFFHYWTLKESYVKARGFGLAFALDRVTFRFVDDVVDVVFDTESPEFSPQWRFALVSAAPQHVIAVASATVGAPLSLRAARITAF